MFNFFASAAEAVGGANADAARTASASHVFFIKKSLKVSVRET